jgi:hypothetical protein
MVGRTYPPEFYSWITVPKVRNLFEKMATETEEDLQKIADILREFGVTVLRPQLPKETKLHGKFLPPPMTPRDYTIMIGDVFYSSYGWCKPDFARFYLDVKDPTWPECDSLDEFQNLPPHIKQECRDLHNMDAFLGAHKNNNMGCYDEILDMIQLQGNRIVDNSDPRISGAMISRIGRDLYFGTENYDQDNSDLQNYAKTEFSQYRTHIVNTGGHSDGTYCPVCPGLIISLRDVPTYKHTFPDWEVVYLPGQSWAKVKDFLALKEKNRGRWWIPGWEHDQDVVATVETWLRHWVGHVEETVFDVNMLMVDPKNVIVFNYNKQVFDALERYGITAHVVNFRHRYFWDGGIHCVTSDLHRQGIMQDYFTQRG